MNRNGILRALNILFICGGYQIHWFSVEAQKFQINIAALINLIILAFWYAICFRAHFLDASAFNFLTIIAPILHKIIRLHLLMGLKMWLLVFFDMKHLIQVLNDLINTLPSREHIRWWSWNNLMANVWLFSGLLINAGFGVYIMVEMEFHMPTQDQIMHAAALFIPHFALACSFKVLNLASLFSKFELQDIHSKTNESFQKKIIKPPETVDPNSTVLSVISTDPSYLENSDSHLETMQVLVKKLEDLAITTEALNQAIQKQILFLFLMNSISLLGASYIIVYYITTWNMILAGPIGNSLYIFNIGVFVFIFWDYFSLYMVNYGLKQEKSSFLKDIIQVLRSKSPMEENVMLVLKDMKYLLKHNFNMRIFFDVSISWQALLITNALIGLAIGLFISLHYLDENIENLESQLEAEGK